MAEDTTTPTDGPGGGESGPVPEAERGAAEAKQAAREDLARHAAALRHARPARVVEPVLVFRA